MSDKTTTLPASTQERVGRTSVRKIKDAEAIYEELDDEIDHDIYEKTLSDLLDNSTLVKEVDEDEDRTYYRARDGLGWSEVVKYECPIKRKILLLLIDNPQTFFVLYNTQKGKFRIVVKEIRKWKSAENKVVTFLVVDNSKDLADQSTDQSVNGTMKELDETIAKVFLLSSNKTDVTVDGIRTYIDAYAVDDDDAYKMPVIVSLNNPVQIPKVLALMNHIKSKVERRASSLRFGIVFDEADKVYPPIRDDFISLLIEDSRALHRLGFVTATEGVLMDSDYPECANAYMYQVPPGHPDYRAFHTESVEIIPNLNKQSNAMYAETILTNYKDHFASPVTLKNGSEGFRKIIVNGDTKTASMETFARNRIADGYYAMTVNMYGVCVYRPGYEKKQYSTKNVRFNQLLFKIYVELKLHDKPLFIIGRRKVDRGLSFHYAPPDGTDGLIWTDMILGRIDDKDTAVQKAGRLSGKVAQCPQYAGLTWWTDEKTAHSIRYHNTVVDEANTKRGYSALQAITCAKSTVPIPVKAETPNDVIISEQTFATSDDAKEWGKAQLDQTPSKMSLCGENREPGGRTHFVSLHGHCPILSEQDSRASNDLRAGLGSITDYGERTKTGSPRIMPVFVGVEIRYVVVYKRFNIRV